jgi:hypothetical protein
MHSRRRIQCLLGLGLVVASFGVGAAELLLTPVQDTSIFTGNGLETRSDGASDFLWTSVTAGGVNRRALLKFDTSAIPPGSVISQVTLSIYESRARDEHVLSLHRLLRSWGEGTSNGGGSGEGAPAEVGDATWLHAFYPNVSWTQPGGDRVLTASASRLVGAPNVFYDWGPTAGMTADVQLWVDQPASNHGWILVGDEQGLQNAKRFESRSNGASVNRPRLRVVYQPPADGEVPLPAWALALLALAIGTQWMRARTAQR